MSWRRYSENCYNRLSKVRYNVMKNSNATPVARTTLQELIANDILKEGQPLFMSYTQIDGKERLFNGTVRWDGIEVDGTVYSPSYSAVYCIAKTKEKRVVNGWLVWKNKDGKFLSELFEKFRKERTPEDISRGYTEKFYKYPQTRDVVFVFGAGASYADGAPLQGDILPIILSDESSDIRKTPIHQLVEEFITDNFAWDKVTGYYPTLEAVFGFLDYFIQRDEGLSRKYSVSNLRNIKESLIKLIHYVISEKTERKSEVYRQFWESVYKYNRNISVITLNYDTFLEDAFAFMYPLHSYLDYCIHIMNYDHKEHVGSANWWVNPREAMPSWEGKDPISIKLIKVHGSLNWKYCNCCNQVLLTPWEKKINLADEDCSGDVKGPKGRSTSGLSGYRCPSDDTDFQTLIVYPSHLKNLSHPIISNLFIETSQEIRRSKRVVFVGYSLPEADIHIRAILKRSLVDTSEIVVVDINDSDSFRVNFGGLSKDIAYVKSSFENLVSNDEMMRQILTLSGSFPKNESVS